MTLEESARRSTEIDMLRKHLKDEEEVIGDLQNRLNQAQEKQWEASGIGSQAVREVEILKKQVSGLENHCRSLSDESEARATELLSSRKASVQASFALKLKLTEAEEKASSSLEELSRVKKELDGAKRKADSISEDLKDARKAHATECEGLEKELSAAKCMSDLYKSRGEEAEEQLKREVSDGTTRVNSLRELLQVHKEQALDILAKAKAEAESIIERQNTELVKAKERIQELEDLEKQRHQQHVPQGPEYSAPMVKKGETGAVDVALLDHHLPSSLSSVADMQDRIVESEEALGKERAERRRLEKYLNRVLSEVDSKAPIIASQKLDYRRALASHEHVSARLEEALVEIRELEGVARIARTEKDSAEREVRSLKQTAADLGLQVQVLLRQQLKENLGRGSSGAAIIPADDHPSGGIEPSVIISRHLVSFRDVAELQQRNEQLLRVVRKLSEERVSVEKANLDASAAADAVALAESMRELEDLKRSRARQEEMVAAIVEQRDMYRLLLAQESQKLLTGTSSSSTNMNGGAGNEADGGVKELSRKLVEAESEVRRMKEECEKRIASEADANKGLQDAVNDAAEARRDAAHANAEATFSRGRYQDLMNTMEQRQSEVETLHKELVTLNALQLSLQRDLEGARADVDREGSRAQSLDRTNIHLSAELSSVNQTCERLKGEKLELRQSSQRQESLMDSLKRLERGFTARVAEERAVLEESNRSLRTSLEESVNELTDVKAQLAALEAQNIEAVDARKERSAANDARDASAEAREALLKEQAESRVLREKVEVLERQLPSGKKLSSGTSGDQPQLLAGEGGRPAADWSFRVIKAQAAEEEAKEAEVAARNHMKQYQAIAKGKETQLKEVTDALVKSRVALEDNRKTAEKKEEELREEMRKERERTRPLLDGLVEAEKAADAAKREAQTKVADAKAGLDSTKRANEQLERQISDMKREVKQLQEAISSVQENYDRELHEHSQAIARLREAEERGSTMRKSRDGLEEINSKLTEELVKFQAEQKTSVADLRGRMEVALEDSKALRAQNDLLHSQLSSLSKESEERIRDRHNRAEAVADAATAAAGVPSRPLSEQKEGEEESDIVMVEGAADEVTELRKSLSDLREVVRFLRRERELSEAEKQTVEAQAGRLKASLAQAQVALRSARAELRSLAEEKDKGAVGEEGGGGISEAEHAKLVAQATQLSTLRESNTLLRSQLQEAHGKAARLTSTVASLEKSVEPSKLAEENLKASLAEVEAELSVRKREVESWRHRAAMLVQDYQKIDPEDHKKLQSELETTISERQAAEARVKDAEDRGKQALERQRVTSQSHQNKLQLIIRSDREKHLKEKEELAQEMADTIAKAEVDAAANARALAVKETNPSDTARDEELDSLKKEHQSLKKHLEHEKKMGEKLRKVARNIRTKLTAEEEKTKVLEEKIATTGPQFFGTTTTTTVERPLIPPPAGDSSGTSLTADVSNWNTGPSQPETSSTAISVADTEPPVQTSTGGEPSTTYLPSVTPVVASPATEIEDNVKNKVSKAVPPVPGIVSGEEGTGGGVEVKKAMIPEGPSKRMATASPATYSQEQLMKKRKQGEQKQCTTMQDSSSKFPAFFSAASSSQPAALSFGDLLGGSQAKRFPDSFTQMHQSPQQQQQQLQENEEAEAAARAAAAVATLKASSTRTSASPPAPLGGPASSEATAPLPVKGMTSFGSLLKAGFGSSPAFQSSKFGRGTAFAPTTTSVAPSAARDTGVPASTTYSGGFGAISAPPDVGTAGAQPAAGGDSFVFLPPTTGGKAPTFGASSLPVPVPSSQPQSPGQKQQEWLSPSVRGGHIAVGSSAATFSSGAAAAAGSTTRTLRTSSENNESKLPGFRPPHRLVAQEAAVISSAESSYPPTGEQMVSHDTRGTQIRPFIPSTQFTAAQTEEGEIIASEEGAHCPIPVPTTTTTPISVVAAKTTSVSRSAGIMSNQERMALRQKRFGGGAEGGGVFLGSSAAAGEAVDSSTGNLRDTTVSDSESKEVGGTQIAQASDVQKLETTAGEGGNVESSHPTGGGEATPADESTHDLSK